MKLIKCKSECDVCDARRVSTQEIINPQAPKLEANLIYMCDKCKIRYNGEQWIEWLQAIKLLQSSIQQ
jgi:hypothetical protein